jgi:hypothetical protein
LRDPCAVSAADLYRWNARRLDLAGWSRADVTPRANHPRKA